MGRTESASRGSIHIEAEVERKLPSLPRFLVVPSPSLTAWDLSGTSTVLVEINGVPLGRRALKQWRERDAWFFDLTEAQAQELGIDRGDLVSVELMRADQSPPAEVMELLENHPSARERWDGLSPSRRRLLCEHVRSGKRAETRYRRARAALGVSDDQRS